MEQPKDSNAGSIQLSFRFYKWQCSNFSSDFIVCRRKNDLEKKSNALYSYWPFLTMFQPKESVTHVLAILLWDIIQYFLCGRYTQE